RSPDSSFASLPPISARVLAARQRVRPQPVWKLRASRTATAAAAAVVAVVAFIAVAFWLNWESPYRVIAKPIESRIHLGKDEDQTPGTTTTTSQQQQQQPAAAGVNQAEAVSTP
ncbi:MAG: hypothetical protein JST31_17040, partial [Actinobacteria bacterium]|nr:hypothetical protein [Actinomycetota bacterium]